ncbi:MAG: hypothetical protein HC780_05780 [Leptolyngbyaceae cyanobacterium CSU_1_3]|nr:hypothetical protein [Leptolyngbyaceae cyanobacterium CSU_1_3]
MAGSVEQITQSLAALDRQIEEMSEAFYQTYSSYLAALGQGVRQQLILSCYHVCTEGYPEAFLRLSLGQRERLQQAVRTLAAQSQEAIVAQLKPIAHVEETVESEPSEPEAELKLPIGTISSASNAENALELLLNAARSQRHLLRQSATPIDRLLRWQDRLEWAIAQQLQTSSQSANQLLQQAKILPHLPEPLLEAAAQAEGSDIAGTPNLLNVSIETSEKPPNLDSPSEMMISHMQVVAVHLRLNELEFNDPAVIAWRNKLRDLKKRLQTLGREYQKKQKERAIAEAQVVWRSTWTNE